MPASSETIAGTFASAGASSPARRITTAAFLLCVATLAIRWPGVAMFDTISQYEQALSGRFEDWHPPIMARTWSLLIRVWPGTQPFLFLQTLLWWMGFGLVATALARVGRVRTGWATLAVGAFPLFLGWETVVLKDSQLACCLIAATGLVAHWRLAGERIPNPARAAILALIAYATLVRGNAVFATVPFAFALFDWAGLRGFVARGAMVLAAILAVLVAGPLINHQILGAVSTKVERTLPLYDVVGIAHQAHLPTVPGLDPALWRQAEARNCTTPYFWNPYGMESQCEVQGDRIAFDAPSGAPVMRLWVTLVLHHPLAWIEHRARHFNSNIRFLVGRDEADATPPIHSEKNQQGLGGPDGAPARALIAAARFVTLTPAGWPVVWLGVAAALLWAGWETEGAVARLARALAGSAVTMSASYAVVSIASDLRYHLWSMLAAALALVLLVGTGGLDRRRWRVGLACIGLLCAVAILARLVLPPEPYPYPVAGKLSGASS